MSYYSGGYKIAEGGKILPSAWRPVIVFTTPWNASSSTLADLNETTYTFTVPADIVSFTAHVWGGGGSSTQSFGNGGYSSATFDCTPGDKYKVIPARGAENSNNNGGDSYSEGGYGIGGGCAQDSNDVGAAGAGSGIFYCGSGSTSATSATTIFTKGVLIAGGGAVGKNAHTPGAGNGGTESAVTVYSVAGRGKAGGNSSAGPGYGGFADGRGGNWAGNGRSVGITSFGVGGAVGLDGYGYNYGGGAGGGAGAGGSGGGSGCNAGGGEDATGWGGRGSDEYSNNYNENTGPGAGGDFNSTGGNGFRWSPASCNLGGGGGGSHGSANGAGGFGGGGGGYYSNAGGGGSGCAFGYTGTPTLSTWTNPNSVQLDIFGDIFASAYISTSAGLGRTSSSDGSAPNGAIIITY